MTDVIVLDSGKPSSVGPPLKEEEKQQELDEDLNQLLTQSNDIGEQQQNPEVPLPYTREPKTCPIHLKPVELRISKNGWEYYKCSEWPCMLFCAAP